MRHDPDRRTRRDRSSRRSARRAGNGRKSRLVRAVIVLGILALVLLVGVVVEARTSWIQSAYLSRVASDLSVTVEPGPSDAIRFPGTGPYDLRFGYALLPPMLQRLEAGSFDITTQARASDRFVRLVDRGLFPVYDEKTRAGLTLLDVRDRPYFTFRTPGRLYEEFEAIPELVWRPLLFIESQDFLDPALAHRNPAVEWDRLMAAVGDLGMRALGSDRNVPGASTLATQLEKFRHSPGGATSGAREKLRQMATASVRAYLDGPETLGRRETIVRDYVNSVPLAAIPGYGEVSGLGDGLWAWYGSDFEQVNELLRNRAEGSADPDAARAFRQVLSLFLAHRRPSYYLATEAGRASLAELTDRYLTLLEQQGQIDEALAHAAAEATIQVRSRAPEIPTPSFVQAKAASQVRGGLLTLLGVESLYQLDRLDLTVSTGVDAALQDSVAALFSRAHDPAFVRATGLNGPRILGQNDPTAVVYSFTLLERTPLGNAVRVRTDNLDAPFSLNESARLELGSTAKLRTLVSYLELVAEIHGELVALPPDSVRARRPAPAERDPITTWVVDRVLRNPDEPVSSVLDAAMQRRYSANPGERFVTGGGVQTFDNFDRQHDGRVMTVAEGFRHSVNLVSIRTMRDVIRALTYRLPGSSARVLSDPADPARREVLERFADREGREFMRRFYRRYQGMDEARILETLAEGRRLGALRLSWAFRTVRPEASVDALGSFIRSHVAGVPPSDDEIANLYRRTDPTEQTLSDLGYLAAVHPLELWVARWLIEHPGSSMSETLDAGSEERLEVYRWLFRTHRRNAQDRRIRFMLEVEAFQELYGRWRRLGYPFANIVPSLGTAIGSSGDRPAALADLVGIIQADGVRMPTYYVDRLDFAEGTPYETRLDRKPSVGQRVLSVEVARTARAALLDVVDQGTAARLRGGLRLADGSVLPIGGKTGTGDNRYRVFTRGGGVSERVVNRTSAFVFFIGERYFGAITAYVPGPAAGAYRFTSGLPVQLLQILEPGLAAHLDPEVPAPAPASPAPGSASGTAGGAGGT